MLVLTRLNIGGVSHQAILLARGLQERGCAVRLVCGREEPHEGNMLELAAAEGLDVLRISALRRSISPLNDLRAFFALWRLMRRERPHVVQTNMAKAGLLGRLAARLTGVPVILHVFHGHVFHSYFDSLSTRLITTYERWMSRLSDGLITLTDGLRHELAEYGIAREEHILVIPSLMDFSPFEGAAQSRGHLRAELGVPPGSPLVGMVGRLVPVKNPQMFLDAATLLRERTPQAHFVLVGDGELRRELEDYVRAAALGRTVHFTGWCDDLARVYADLDVVVICSRNEGSPISLLEAAVAGVPVVATRVGGIPDLLTDGKTGLIVESEDTPGLAEAIRGLLERPAGARGMAEAARRALELDGRFSADQQVERYLGAYRMLLARKGIVLSSLDGPLETKEEGSASRRVSRLERTA